MKAEEIHAAKLFGSDQQLLIPLWQRHYSWGRGQWEELWTDLDRVRSEGLAGHFLGSVVLKSLEWTGLPSEAKRYWVVDGQQRVTTLAILVCAIRDRKAQLASSDEDRDQAYRALTNQLLVNSNLKAEHRERLLLQEKDRHALRRLVNADGDLTSGHPVEQAYSFFKGQIAPLDAKDLEGLLSIILAKLTAVWVTLEEGDNAHRVFQTLNAGGKKLRQADLVRNYFFLLLGDLGEKFYEKKWRQLEGDLTDREMEDFLVAWSISQGHTGGRDSLFTYFHKDLVKHESEPALVYEYGSTLTEAARYFRWIRDPSASHLGSDAKRSLSDLQKWSTLPAEGLILLLLRHFALDKLSEPSLRQALEIVLSFMARRQLGGYEPNLHKSIFVTVARKLRQRDDLIGQESVDYLRYLLSLGEEVRTWPSDDAIKEVVRTNPIYSGPRSGWAFLILERINRQLFEQKKHEPHLLSKAHFSVEHVLPQKLTTAWIMDLHDWGVSSPEKLHESRLHVLGNLTLTVINSELSNLPFSVKKDKLQDDWLKLNQKLSESNTWTESTIDERSNSLASKALVSFIPPLTGEELKAAKAKFGDSHGSTGAAVDEVEAALEEEGG